MKSLSLKLCRTLKTAGIEFPYASFWWCNGTYVDDFGWMLAGGHFEKSKNKNKLGIKPLTFINPKKDIWHVYSCNPAALDRYGAPEYPIKWYAIPSIEDLLALLPHGTDIIKRRDGYGVMVRCDNNVNVKGYEEVISYSLNEALALMILRLPAYPQSMLKIYRKRRKYADSK